MNPLPVAMFAGAVVLIAVGVAIRDWYGVASGAGCFLIGTLFLTRGPR